MAADQNQVEIGRRVARILDPAHVRRRHLIVRLNRKRDDRV